MQNVRAVLEDYCELQFVSEPAKVRDIVTRLLNFVDAYSPPLSVRSDLKLVFSELIYNAIIHGNREDRSKRVRVWAKMQGDILVAAVQDEGPGFNYRQIIEYAQTETALLNEYGRGMVLVCGLTDDLSFNETGNVIIFEKRLR